MPEKNISIMLSSISPEILVSHPTMIVGLCSFSFESTYAPACPNCIASVGVSSSLATPLTPSVPNNLAENHILITNVPDGYTVAIENGDNLILEVSGLQADVSELMTGEIARSAYTPAPEFPLSYTVPVRFLFQVFPRLLWSREHIR